MSKKSRRTKQRGKQVQSSYINRLHIEQMMNQANKQLHQGDFAGAVDTCQHLLKRYLQRPTSQRVEVLAYMGLANAMLQRFQESYDIFTEAVSIDPTNAELWYNRGLASNCTTRLGQAVLDFERAVELLDTTPALAPYKDDVVKKFTDELEKSRKLAEEAMQLRGPDFTLDQLIEQDEAFQRGLSMTRAGKWKEAEQAFRRVIEMGECLPQYSGNLGVVLLMQQRYDEAEAALKRALKFDPHYKLARENLAAIPALRRSGRPAELRLRNELQESDVDQTITLYQPGNDTQPAITSTIKKLQTTTKLHLGKQPSRYRFFLNPYEDVRFTRCPQCGNKTRQRKLPLVIHIEPMYILSLNKTCRYCPDCDLLIAHRDQLESLLVAIFEEQNPDIIGNDYVVLGTVDRANWKEGVQHGQTGQNLLDALHDFKEVITFKPVVG
jgi:Flp pilus assembly protein TadD